MRKKDKIRLTGKALAKLNADIHKRDGNCCIICGAWVDPGEKFHHEPCGADKQDRVECGVTLCWGCHDDRHFNGELLKEVRDDCRAYLRRMYPEYWGDAQ